MSIRWQQFQQVQLESIHDATMKVLKEVGIRFPEPEAIEIFKANGVKVSNDIVFLDEKTVKKALETVPSKFVIEARNPEKNVTFDVERNTLVIAPSVGAVFVLDEDGDQREATMDDYNNFCKLVHTSKYIDMNGVSMVAPSDIPQDIAHLDMTFSNMIYSDKVFMGGMFSREAAIDSMEMAGLLWGGDSTKILNKPVMLGCVSALSPLQWAKDMAGALIEYARSGQPLRINTTPSAGSTAPVTLAGLFTQTNAELLSGIVLAQLINPGVPVIYSSSCAPTNMRTGEFSPCAPESTLIATWVAQMANFYGMPARGVGAVTESHCLDYQAGIESARGLISSVVGGVNFILQSFGMLSSGMCISYEKFIIDEDQMGMIARNLRPIDVSSETIDLSTIAEVGIGGQYLTHPKTFEKCRSEFYVSDVMYRQNFDTWKKSGKKRVDETAKEIVQTRLAEYVKPELDTGIEDALGEYVDKRKKEY